MGVTSITLVCALAAVSALASTTTQEDENGPLRHAMVLDEFGHYVMLWTPQKKNIIIEVQVAALGYIGLGFSPNGDMKGSDIILGWVREDGLPYISDRYAPSRSSPLLDDSQDVQLIRGYKNSTHTVLRFKRPWVTCDKEHDLALNADTVRLIYAYHKDVPDPTASESLPYHNSRGGKSIYLMEPKSSVPKVSSDVQYFDLRSPNVSLTNGLNTLYWCKIFKMPPLEVKNHYIGYQPIIQSGHTPFVHHMLVYECHVKNESIFEPWTKHQGHQCYGPNMPQSWFSCNVPLVTWAYGSDGMSLPPETGYPIGSEFSGATYFMMEVHYDNPKLVPDIYDSSGLRLFHTTKLRQYDTGSLQVGHSVSPDQIIGPGVKEWKTINHCSAECTEKGIPPEGIKLTGAVLHAHLIGQSISVRHIRNGVELEPIFRDHHYDFNYQQERVLQEPRTVLPGDELITECVYDSSEHKRPTYGGFGTDDEMCLVYMQYYPRVDFGQCMSITAKTELYEALGLKVYAEDSHIAQQLLRPALSSFQEDNLDWEKEMEAATNVMPAGEQASMIKIAMLHRRVIVKEPYERQNTSLYAVLQDPLFWGTPERAQSIMELINTKTRNVVCSGYGKRILTGTPVMAKMPEFVPYSSPETDCTNYV